MSDPRDETRTWLRGILASTGWTPTELARRARVAQTTLTRFLNDADHAHDLSRRTIAAIASAARLPQPGIVPERRPGFAESDATPFAAASDGVTEAMVRHAIAGAPGVNPWVMGSRALELAGYLPGDVLVIDLNAEPRSRDAVCAQVYAPTGMSAETVMRIWQPPFLVAASMDERFGRPILVDNDLVVIRGVIVAGVRPRRSAPH
jgi:transcriptional regulator with XRE-family HTH domain